MSIFVFSGPDASAGPDKTEPALHKQQEHSDADRFASETVLVWRQPLGFVFGQKFFLGYRLVGHLCAFEDIVDDFFLK